MSTQKLVLAAAAAAALVAAGCDEDKSAPAPAKGADPVKLEVKVEKPKVALGEDVVFDVKLTNTGSAPVQVAVPRIDRKAFQLRVKPAEGSPCVVERIYGELVPRGRTVDIAYAVPEAKTLEPGASLEQKVSTVAVLAGKLAFTPVYTRPGASEPLAAPAIDVEVVPAEEGKTHLGVKLETSQGAVVAKLRPDLAYNTVESFATLVRRGYYTGVKFHRIVKGFMAQGGDPTGKGDGGPGYMLPLEANRILLHRRGVMSMARAGHPDSAGSQFFLMFTTYPSLDPTGRPGGEGYTSFGEMVEGDDTLKKLENVPCRPNPQTGEPAPIEPVVIERASLVHLP